MVCMFRPAEQRVPDKPMPSEVDERHALRSPDLRRDPCLGLSSACLVPLRDRESIYMPTLLLTSSPLTLTHTPTTTPS